MAHPEVRTIRIVLWARTSSGTNPMKSKFPHCPFITLDDFFYMMVVKGIIMLFVGNKLLCFLV
jgi:hypothetical protein